MKSLCYEIAAVAALIVALLLCYSNSLHAPFLQDDAVTILRNPSIEHLLPIGPVLDPPGAALSAGRPLLNLSYAVDYRIGDRNVIIYHWTNILIHFASALLIYSLVWRLASISHFEIKDPFVLSLAISLIWMVHPLQTESVTYISQRAESLMGLMYLATFYCFIRGTTESSGLYWLGASVAACAAGMATKEVMITAPVLILLSDIVILRNTLSSILQRRLGYYLALFGTWLLLAFLMLHTKGSTRAIGFHGAYSWFTYGLVECEVVVRYLSLAVFPYPLVFDYGPAIGFTMKFATEVICGASLAIALFACIRACCRRNIAGFLGLSFFTLLAPTSSVVPVQLQPMAESRMYLPLTPIIAMAVLLIVTYCGKISKPLLAIIILIFIATTVNRNSCYSSAISMWADTVAKVESNARAHNELASSLAASNGGWTRALEEYKEALRIDPDYAVAHNNIGLLYSQKVGYYEDSLSHYMTAIKLVPDYFDAHYNLANLFSDHISTQQNAIEEYYKAISLNPQSVEAHCNLATLLSDIPGREDEAATEFEAAIRLDPRSFVIHYNYGNLLDRQVGMRAQAIAEYRAAIRLNPDFAPARAAIANDLRGGSR